MHETHSDELREGFAGMHDLIGSENVNRKAKSIEIVTAIETIYLPQPESFVRGRHKMLLVQGPHDEREGNVQFPLGLGYIARILIDIGVNVEVLDAHAEHLTPEQTIEQIRSKTFDLVGITALSTQYGFVKWLAAELKILNPNVLIIVGGQLAHYNSHTLIEHTAVDVAVIGEGEITIQDVIYNISSLSNVAGIAFRDETGGYQRNPDRLRIKNPEIIPFPAWDAFNIEYYFQHGTFGSQAKRTINVLTSRGCPYSCTFCSLSFPNVTYRSVDNVIKEIEYLIEKFGIDGVDLSDELFIISKKRVYEFCEKVKPLGISWGGQGRANIVNDDENLLRTMKDAGAVYVGYGLESATSDMLSRMQKKTTVENNKNAMLATLKVGLQPVAQYMFGFPGETLESIKAGVEFFDEIHYVPPVGPNAPPHISLTVALPGSQLYEDAKQSGLILDEDEYLTKITRGYYFNDSVVVNLTSFTDEELFDLKALAEQQMVDNYMAWMRKQGRLSSFRTMSKIAFDLLRYQGFFNFTRKLMGRVAFNLKLFFSGDRSALNPSNLYYFYGRSRTDYATRSNRGAEFRRYFSNK